MDLRESLGEDVPLTNPQILGDALGFLVIIPDLILRSAYFLHLSGDNKYYPFADVSNSVGGTF